MITGHPLEAFINGPAHHTLHHLYFTVNYGQVHLSFFISDPVFSRSLLDSTSHGLIVLENRIEILNQVWTRYWRSSLSRRTSNTKVLTPHVARYDHIVLGTTFCRCVYYAKSRNAANSPATICDMHFKVVTWLINSLLDAVQGLGGNSVLGMYWCSLHTTRLEHSSLCRILER
jgi:hypothetical protein